MHGSVRGSGCDSPGLATDDSFACRVTDGGRPPGVVVEAGAPNYLPLLRSKGRGSEQRRLKGPETNRVK
jgi:hypothetical protein